MDLEVRFVNFPKSVWAQQLITSKITECVSKFAHHLSTISIKAIFSLNRNTHQVKILLQSGKIDGFVNARAHDVAHAVDSAILKLETLIRKNVSKRKHKKVELPHVAVGSVYDVVNLREIKRNPRMSENVFDRYESQYAHEFEDNMALKNQAS